MLFLGLEEVLAHSGVIKNCSDEVSATNTYFKFAEYACQNPRKKWLLACPVPCQQTTYVPVVRNFHANSWYEPSKSETVPKCVYFTFAYESFLVEVSVETLMYDSGNFWAAVGGNLGLFLGFSCLSVLYQLIQQFKKFRYLNIFF